MALSALVMDTMGMQTEYEKIAPTEYETLLLYVFFMHVWADLQKGHFKKLL